MHVCISFGINAINNHSSGCGAGVYVEEIGNCQMHLETAQMNWYPYISPSVFVAHLNACAIFNIIFPLAI